MSDPTTARAKRIFYSILAPRWRTLRPSPSGLQRRWLLWEVVRETVHGAPNRTGVGWITAFGYERVSAHWTWRGANRAAMELQEASDQ